MKKIIYFIAGALIFGTAGVCAGQLTATENPFPVKFGGEYINIDGYNIADSSYFKLRDIASAIGGFDVDFVNDTIVISKDEEEEENEEQLLKSYYNNVLVKKYGTYTTERTEVKTFMPSDESGMLAYYLYDFDNDNHSEMITLCSKGNESNAADLSKTSNSAYMYIQIYDIENHSVVLKDETRLLLNNNPDFSRCEIFLHEYKGKPYICFTQCKSGINGNLYTEHRIISYDGSVFVNESWLVDPGYTDGSTLYRKHYEDEHYTEDDRIAAIADENGYEKAIADEGKKFGLDVVKCDDRVEQSVRNGQVEERRTNGMPMYTADDAVRIAAINTELVPIDLNSDEPGSRMKTIRTISIGNEK